MCTWKAVVLRRPVNGGEIPSPTWVLQTYHRKCRDRVTTEDFESRRTQSDTAHGQQEKTDAPRWKTLDSGAQQTMRHTLSGLQPGSLHSGNYYRLALLFPLRKNVTSSRHFLCTPTDVGTPRWLLSSLACSVAYTVHLFVGKQTHHVPGRQGDTREQFRLAPWAM